MGNSLTCILNRVSYSGVRALNLKSAKSRRGAKTAPLPSPAQIPCSHGKAAWLVGAPGHASSSWCCLSTWLTQSIILQVTGNLQIHHQCYLPTYTLIYEQSKWFTLFQRRALLQRNLSCHQLMTWSTFQLKGIETWLCCASGLEQRGCWESEIVLAIACQTHSSGERSYGPWPSVLVWPRPIHSCSLFRLSKQDPARLRFVNRNSARLTSNSVSECVGYSKAEAPK